MLSGRKGNRILIIRCALLSTLTLMPLSAAAAESPRVVIMNVAALATNGNWKQERIEKEYFTSDLRRFLKHVDQKRWRDFDGDLLTGTQEPNSLSVLDVVEHSNVATAIYSGDKGTHKLRVDYIMRKEGGEWKVHDIVYHAVGVGNHQIGTASFRQMMTRKVVD